MYFFREKQIAGKSCLDMMIDLLLCLTMLEVMVVVDMGEAKVAV